MPAPGEAVRDWVVPVMARAVEDGRPSLVFKGTAFGLADQAVAVTASHVIEGLLPTDLTILTVIGNRWVTHEIFDVEHHPEEDLAKLTLPAPLVGAPLTVNRDWHGSSMRYTIWGYPLDAQYDLTQDGVVRRRPDLVFSAGHVRRRIAVPMAGFRGHRLFELGAPAGSGCSGAPVLRDPGWTVVGVYIGERLNEAEGLRVGYAVRLADVWDWLGR